MRMRFIDRDGVSFFEDINFDPGRAFMRMLPLDPSIDFASDMTLPLGIEYEVYERETWFVYCGPVACGLPVLRYPEDDRIDVAYRFKRIE